MSFIDIILSKFTLSNVISISINLIFFTILVLLFLGIMELMIENYKEKKLKGLIKQNQNVSKIRNLTFLKKLANNLEIVLKEKNKESAFSLIFYSILGLALSSMIGLILVKQVLLAIIAPIVILKLANEICIRLSTDLIESLEEQLPFAIDNIIRISTKYSDIKSIIYEASRTCEQPIKGILENISREMLSSPADEVLMDYAEKYDNVWFYSVVFTLISYLEDSSKEETIKNLKHLRDILEKENLTKKASVTDKRYGVMVNLVISILGIVGFVINLLITPNAKVFFFSTFSGLLCFVLGFVCFISTIFINIKMMKVKKE